MKKNILIVVLIVILIRVSTFFNITPDKYSGISDEYSYMEINDLAYNRIIESYEENPQTFPTSKVVINPLGTNYLSEYVIFSTDSEITYNYVVEGKDDISDFNFGESESEVGVIAIPVIGLYANYNNTVNISITSENGSQTEKFNIDTSVIDIPDEYIKANISEPNSEMKEQWLVTSQGLAYDINGNLRMYGLASDYNWVLNFTEIINDKYFIGDTDIHGAYYVDQLYAVDFMGRVKNYVQDPENYTFHHDGIYENGYYYFLGNVDETSKLDEFDDMEYRESAILVYDDDLKFVETIDLSSNFNEETQVLINFEEMTNL